MPSATLRYCAYPGCPERVAKGRCIGHTKQQRRADDAKRNGAAHRAIYDTKAWKVLKAQVLAEEPICRRCGREYSMVVDHIVPISAGGAPFDRNNLQGLCVPDHNAKTRSEQNRGIV